jgi:SagB-type dehydrogenase family enzyme
LLSMPEVSIAEHYHQRTKYSPEGLAVRSRSLDFEQQPSPFKDYKLGQSFDLKAYLQQQPDNATTNQWYRLSRLLYCSYGLTGVVNYPGNPFYMRAAPSAGGLYPAEIYLICREDGLLPAGIYNYQVQTHSLIQVWQSYIWQELQSACLWHPALEHTQLALVVTAVFFRSAWRYDDRAYRRIFLDSGHLLGNIELAASLNDYRPHLIAGFVDRQINNSLYLDPEQEGTLAVLPLADLLVVEQNLPPTPTVLPSPVITEYPQLEEGQLLAFCHQQTQIESTDVSYAGVAADADQPAASPVDKYNFPFCLKVPTQISPLLWQSDLQGLEATILRRRSTRRYTGESMTLADLSTILDFTYHPEHYRDQGLDNHPDYCDLSLIETFIAISGVTGLEDGCYYYAPRSQELRQIRFKNFRRELHYLCLQQELGRDAAAVVFHTADLSKAIGRYGDRVYRYLHLDAGHLGQRLNLAAIQLNLGVSGIAGFFDDQVNEVLGIPADEAVLYITTLGQPA